jgi:hypothetical protein
MSERRRQIVGFGRWVVETALMFGASPAVAFRCAGELVGGLLDEDAQAGPGPHRTMVGEEG